uniref:Uncharacterized protein n=1 Tax=Panagrolaimus sp. PS1159 TaxID=55785 RepID=A0AC35GQB7_9BILA
MENDILSIIKAIADEAISNSESNGVEQSKKLKISTMYGKINDNFNKLKAENEKLKKTIENQNETIKKQALIISQLIEKSRKIVPLADDGKTQKEKAISSSGDEMKSKHVVRGVERNKVLPQNHGTAAAGADTKKFYSHITRDEKELSQTLPQTCNLQIVLLPFP